MNRKITSIFVLTLMITSTITVYGSFNTSDDLIEKPQIQTGTFLKYVLYNGEIRSYRIHIPPNYDGNNPVSLVFNLHGNPSCSFTQMFCSEFNNKADQRGFIVVYPNGHFDGQYLSYWIKTIGITSLITGFRYLNAWDYKNADVDDVGYIEYLIEELNTDFNIDSSRIYVTGHSGGAFMSYRLGAELSDTFAAIAPVAGSIGGRSWIDNPINTNFPIYIIPEPENPLPVIVFHGMQDPNVPYDGIKDVGYGLCFISVNESVSFWVENNGCNPIPDVETSESGNIIKRTYSNGSQGSEVILYTIVDGGHDWFGGPESFFPPCEISATDLIWDFFEAHPKQ